ncbi:c-type cytochrome [Edaphobacter flagellatus]|uniref:c-type cytochrome n=1 Tax=Edaphobacter flagellatus TaxID=1933044 RepID=UPI0021B42216|nr:c-type cytochrome [Edaphobacter flagellatus]
MSKTPAILLSAASLLCATIVSLGVHAKPVSAHMQEPNLQRDTQAPSTNRSHVFLGLGREPDAAAAKRGGPLYKQNCSACHGESARGGIGPNLVRSVLVLHDDSDEEISRVIEKGRAGTSMPPFPSLSATDRRDIAEYLHWEIEQAANRGLYKNADTMSSGDAEKGKSFFAANCANCHSTTGDLAHIATKYPQPAAMLARIAWPTSRMAPRQATVTTPDGQKLTGTLAHYDDFETTLKAGDGKTTTWATDTVNVDISDKLAGHRALLPKYSDDDLHNLTRYLLTLK